MRTTPRLLGWMIAALVGPLLMQTGCANAGRTAAWEARQPAATSTADPATTPAETHTEPAADPEMTRALAAWAARDDRAQLEAAIATLSDIVAREPEHIEALTLLSRAHFFLVDGHLKNEAPDDLDARKLELHLAGANFGERALMLLEPEFAQSMRNDGNFIAAIGKIGPESAAAAYWYCSNLARFSVVKGLSAKLFYKDRVSSAIHRLAEVAPTFFYSAPDRYLGAYYSALPGIAGRDLGKSRRHFDLALQRAPEYLGTKLLEAEFLAVGRDDRADYERLLNEVIAGADSDDPNLAPENRAAKRTAALLLRPEAIDERF